MDATLEGAFITFWVATLLLLTEVGAAAVALVPKAAGFLTEAGVAEALSSGVGVSVFGVGLITANLTHTVHFISYSTTFIT